VEVLLHAFLPHTHVLHTHADDILVLTNQTDGEKKIKAALGEKLAVLPYTHSGLPLAKAVAKAYENAPDIDVIVILHHGIFTFADDGETAYENMIRYVDRAQTYVSAKLKNKALMTVRQNLIPIKNPDHELARLSQVIRGTCSLYLGNDMIRRVLVETRRSSTLVNASLSTEAQHICDSGVLTPDHAIRTKNRMAYLDTIPPDDGDLIKAVKQSIGRFQNAYQGYLAAQIRDPKIDPNSFDSRPTLFLAAGLGLMAIGFSRKDAQMAADLGEHTVLAKLKGFSLGTYYPIADSHVFRMEFWPFQQKKVEALSALPLQGQVAVITGGGGAIGFGIAKQLLAAGAAVVLSDIDKARLHQAHQLLAEAFDSDMVDSLTMDVTDYADVQKGFETISLKFGGVDIVVPNAGIAHVSKIEDLDPEKLEEVLSVNFMGTFTVIKAAIPIFKRQATGGNVIVISSKNVFDPGASFSAYSASKAAAHQISKIAAMELADYGVRVNMINPDAVFGDEKVCSGLWELVGPDRMKSRGLKPDDLQDYYCQRSLLKARVLAEHVGNAVVFFASELTPTTGATLPVDGGNPSAFPR
jgi:rhamnose utilization protein RhaD (predicted bifunctional aldolase and dehydrogenase)/NAD(P)-dependent dehydrogenase (short-subunit alcohol dehydrogenase family)